MGKTFKQERPPGKEYDSARPMNRGGGLIGKATKKFTHHRERRAAVREIAGEIKEAI